MTDKYHGTPPSIDSKLATAIASHYELQDIVKICKKDPLAHKDPTALFRAAVYGKFDIVQYLVDRNDGVLPQKDGKTESYDTAIWFTHLNKHFDIVQYLVEHGADFQSLRNGKRGLYEQCLEWQKNAQKKQAEKKRAQQKNKKHEHHVNIIKKYGIKARPKRRAQHRPKP
jgi:ankyrin repeat protein